MIHDAATIRTLLARKLLAWYDREKRPLPWRETADPYRIWISEIMLQQTRVDTVIPYYQHFLENFPTIRALAEAPLQEVLKAWENLGYYSRAKNLHAAAGIVVRDFGGRLPDTREDLKKLPGIGEYAAGAILSMAYGQAVPAVDGNVRRILSRLFALPDPIDAPRTQLRLQECAAVLVPRQNPGDFNQALMDLGAAICKARAPGCPCCPIAGDCRAKAAGLQDTLPVTKKRPPIPQRQEAAAVIRNRDGLILMVRRPTTGLLASLWRFPGGFLDGADGIEDRLECLIASDLGLQIRVGARLVTVEHVYTHFRLTLHAYEGRLRRGNPGPADNEDRRWVTPAEVRSLPLAKVDRMIIRTIP